MFVIEPKTQFEVKTYFDKLDVHKSTGLGEIGPNILCQCGDQITASIALMIVL